MPICRQRSAAYCRAVGAQVRVQLDGFGVAGSCRWCLRIAIPKRPEGGNYDVLRLALYRFQPGTVDKVIRRGQQELLPMFRQQDGFVAYEVVRTREDTGFAIN